MTETSTARPGGELAPVVKAVVVPGEPGRAFEMFTAQLGDWWPRESHSVGGAEIEALVVEPRVGGQILERLRDGSRVVWGQMLVWEPPARFTMTWHPGRGPDEATEVEVRFSHADGGTRVELEHRGWERRADGAAIRGSYVTGWDLVLAHYAAAFSG